MDFLKKNWSNLILLLVIIILILPQTRRPLQVAMNRVFAFAPREIADQDREEVVSYDWKLASLEGEPVNFQEARGKVAVVNLWATWCPPCIAEMPSFQEVFASYGNRVAFYFVSDEQHQTLKDFLRRKGYRLPVYRPLEPPPASFDSDRLPTTYVISAEGEIVIRKTGAADWNDTEFRATLDRLLGI